MTQPVLAAVAPVDIPTLTAAAVTALLIVGGYHDRKSMRKAPPAPCATCLTPALSQMDTLLRSVRELLVAHNASMDTVDAVGDERNAAIIKALDELRAEIRELRRDVANKR